MKIIFLDVDGVLNTADLIESMGLMAIGDHFLEHLKEIISKTNSQVVLSSTWRLLPNAKKVLEDKLHAKGIFLLDSTVELRKKNSAPSPRSAEISEWLKRHPAVEKFAIIDDCNDAGDCFRSDFFQTTFQEGLTKEITDRVIRHLTV